MTDKLIERIKANREAGTDGPWTNTPKTGEISGPDGVYVGRAILGGVTRLGSANASRIARIPDMEARILADAKILEAAAELAKECRDLGGANTAAILSALANYRAAVEKARQ